jgi:Secretion system C-terminal sorting domain/SdrD B-like domain
LKENKIIQLKTTTPMKFKNRHIVTIFLFFLALVMGQAQGWKRTYPTTSTLFRTAQTNDNGFIGCGINEESQLIVLKMDEDGAVLKTNIFTRISKVSRVQLAKAADGNFLIALNDSSAQIRLVKITQNGDSLWSKRVPFALNIQDFQPLTQGNFGVMGSNNNKKAVFTKLNALGDTVWTKQYSEPTDILNGFVEDNDGTLFWQINDKTTARPILWVLNASGTALNTININTGTNSFYRFEKLKDGNLAVCTAREIVKFRTDGRLIWTITPVFSNEKDIANFTATEDGGVAILGYGSNRVLNETELLKLDANGTKQWSNKITEDVETTPGVDFSLYLLFNLQQTFDKGFLLSGRVENSKNGINKKSGYLVKTIANGLVYANILRGNVSSDLNRNCKIDGGDLPIKGWVLKADGGANKIFNTTTDATGNYNFQLDSGSYKISVFTPNNLWQACFTDSVLNIKGFNRIDTFNIPVKPVSTCSGLRVDIGTPLLRRCFDNIYTVSYCNNGTSPVQNAYVEVALDTTLIFQNATFPVASIKGRIYRFNVGDMDILMCKSFNITVKVSCEIPSLLGRTACTEAHIYPDSICPTWRGAKMEATGRCDRDSLRFNLQNTGQTPTTAPVNFIITEDHVVFLQGTKVFNAGQSQAFAFKPNGKTYRLQATQERGYPTNQALVAVAIEGCGRNTSGDVSKGFALELPEADGDPFVDTDCQSIVGSTESNTLLASPLGYTTDHLIEPNTDMEYMVRFQNVGTDTAFNVIIRDTLSAFLEPTSVEFEASSHPYKAELVGNNILKFTFTAIRLPDSTLNAAASQGFIKFRLRQKPNLALGTKILNRAAVFFDFNKPIVTNSTFHTVGSNFFISAVVEKPKTDGIPIKVYPNPFTEFAVFELEQTDTSTPLSKNSVFKLFDATGRAIRTQHFEGTQLRFERGNLASGMYFFTIENNGKRGSGKLIVQGR